MKHIFGLLREVIYRSKFKYISNKILINKTMPAFLNTVDGDDNPRYNVTVLETPDKSESDRKNYKLIKLSNCLTALLISDPSPKPVSESESDDSTDADTDTASEDSSQTSRYEGSDEENDDDNSHQLAACALTVDVGSFSDPSEIQGMSHFLEHMIFMGSEKYPEENEYDAYIKKCGGTDNADTDCEETSFYFEIEEQHLDGALERFAQLFTSPLLLENTMTREREAIESEFVSKMQGDDVRRDQIIAEMGQNNHPIKTFTWGNQKTLKDGIDDNDLHRKLNEFRQRHYSAHRMYLAIQARLPISQLESMVINNFSSIQNNGLDGEDFTRFKDVFTNDFYQKVYYVKPISDITKLQLSWCLPSYLKEYKTKPHNFISFFIEYEGKGSLCCYLRKKLWALQITTEIDESGFEHNSMYLLFTISIYLTDDGYVNLNEVLNATFCYLRLLQTEKLENHFNELQSIEETTFRFMSEQDPIDNVEDLVVNLKYYPPKHVLAGPHLYYEYNEELINQVVSHLNNLNFNVMISKQVIPEINFDKKEKWFGTEYTTIDFPEDWKNLWNSKQNIPELYLPESNKFISKDFSLLSPTGNSVLYPEKVYDNESYELWYKQDEKFLIPKAFMYFYFISPVPTKNPYNSALFNLYTLLLKYQLVDNLYSAEVAGLNYDTYCSENGLVVEVNGYNEKLHLLIDIITKELTGFLDNITEEMFDTFKKQLEKNYFNAIIKPKCFNRELRLSCIENIHHSEFEKFNLVSSLKLEDLKVFGKEFFNELKVVSIIQGNVTKEHAIDVIKNVLNNIKHESIKDFTTIPRRTVQLPLGDSYLRIKSLNSKDANTVTTNFYQVGKSTIRLESLLDLLVMLIEEPLFDIVRTKEQYGYDVSCSVRDNFSILGFSITITSQETKFNYQQVEKRIEKFLFEFLKILKKMPDKEFNCNKESLIKLNQIIDHKLKDEVGRNWHEIVTEEYIFDRRERLVNALRSITQQELIKFYEGILKDVQVKRKLSVQVIGEHSSSVINEDQVDKVPNSCNIVYVDDSTNISDIFNFKKDLYVYPKTNTTI